MNAPVPETAALPRVNALDALRGLAVVLMMDQHFGKWLFHRPRGYAHGDYPVFALFQGLGSLAAPLFIGLSGIGYAIMCRGDRASDRVLVLRGLFILLLGCLVNLTVPGWFSWGSFYVLHLIGFAVITTPLWRRLPTPALWALGAAVLAATPLAQYLLGTPGYLDHRRMGQTDLPGGVLRLALAEGHFPILPWIFCYLVGIVAGRQLVEKRTSALGRTAVALFVLGSAMTIAYGLYFRDKGAPDLLACAFRVRTRIYPAGPPIILLLTGLALGILYAGLRIEQRRGLSPSNPLVSAGRTALTLFVFHLVAVRGAIRLAGLWRSFSWPWALAITAALIVLCVYAASAWRRRDYRYGFEWLMRRVAG